MSPQDRATVHAALDIFLEALERASTGRRDDGDLVVLRDGILGLASGRSLMDAARRGEIADVSKCSKKLVAPRASVMAWCASRPAPRKARPVAPEPDAAFLERAGLRVVGRQVGR